MYKNVENNAGTSIHLTVCVCVRERERESERERERMLKIMRGRQYI